MKNKKIIFGDAEIVEFCTATKDTNEIHNPAFMEARGKRAIVPGMLALCSTINLSSEFLKNKGNSIIIYFNSMLSSGDFVTLCNSADHDNPGVLRLSAINHKDALSSNGEYSRIFKRDNEFEVTFQGLCKSLPVNREMIDEFSKVTGGTDPDVSRFLFAVAYTSQALLKCIENPQTEVETEIDKVINRNSGISPFYHTLEIHRPTPFPFFEPEGFLDYFIHFTTEKQNRLYNAHVRCECRGQLIFHSRYKMIGVSDTMIYRMAKDISHPRRFIS